MTTPLLREPLPDGLSDLINIDRVRSSIRRLFQNDIAECLVELFQNSQRARARVVEIETSEEGFTYRDDGHGLLDGVEGFHTLLKIAESHFDNETISDQDPMGLGIHALLAHDAIREITFASGGHRLTLDTKLWWTDRDYYTHWFTQLEELAEPVRGFEVVVTADAKLVSQLKQAFTNLVYPYRKTGPAEGYTCAQTRPPTRHAHHHALGKPIRGRGSPCWCRCIPEKAGGYLRAGRDSRAATQN